MERGSFGRLSGALLSGKALTFSLPVRFHTTTFGLLPFVLPLLPSQTYQGRDHTSPVVPILRIFDVDKPRDFYVDDLGFNVDWEQRFADEAPLYMQASRVGVPRDRVRVPADHRGRRRHPP